MDTSDDVITLEDTPPEDVQIEYAWRDDNWLVLHEKKAVLPRRCVVCDQPAVFLLDHMPLSESRTASDWLSHSVFFSFLAFARFLDNAHSRDVCVQLPFCDEHYQLIRRRSLLLGWLYIMGFLLLLIGSAGMIIYVVILGLQFEPTKWPSFSILAGVILILCELIANIFKPEPIRLKKFKKPFVWLEDVSPEYLARFPEVPRQ